MCKKSRIQFVLTDFEQKMVLEVGTLIPNILINTSNGNSTLYEECKSKWTLFFSYFEDFNPICLLVKKEIFKQEIVSLVELNTEFKRNEVEIIIIPPINSNI